MSHQYTAEEVGSFHKALYRACGLPALTPGYSDQQAWWTFLEVVRPFETETEEGRFKLDDLIETLAAINKENAKRDPKFRIAMRPFSILRDPEKLRDLVLMAREEKRRRKRPAIRRESVTAGDVTIAVDRDPSADAPDFDIGKALQQFTDFREGRIDG
jgi:hypothetical protein